MELWDAYDNKGKLIKNITLVRGETIPDGLYHLVCDILVKHIDGTYLLMQRDNRKSYGGMWEASAGGSALKGETAFDCAVRELQEETGVFSNDLQEFGRIINHNHHTIYVEYLCVYKHNKDLISLQDGETQDYKWVNKETLVNMSKQELLTDRCQLFIKELQR